MPELPEVETTRRGIAPHLERQIIEGVVIRQPKLRWAISRPLKKAITGREVLSVGRRGKYLRFAFENGHMLLHLGMSGSLRLVPSDQPPGKHDHVDFQLGSGRSLRFTDPRRFGAVLWTDEPIEQHTLLKELGPEPLTSDLDGEWLFQRSRKRRVTVKNFIMDSKVVVGVGNIYANEALFLAGIRPRRRAGKVTRLEYQQLVWAIKEVLHKAIAAGGTTLRNFSGGDGQPGYFKQQLFVYGREGEPCRRCDTPLKNVRVGQRATVYCPRCQS